MEAFHAAAVKGQSYTLAPEIPADPGPDLDARVAALHARIGPGLSIKDLLLKIATDYTVRITSEELLLLEQAHLEELNQRIDEIRTALYVTTWCTTPDHRRCVVMPGQKHLRIHDDTGPTLEFHQWRDKLLTLQIESTAVENRIMQACHARLANAANDI